MLFTRHLFSKLRAPVAKFTQFELYDVQFYWSFWKELVSKWCHVPHNGAAGSGTKCHPLGKLFVIYCRWWFASRLQRSELYVHISPEAEYILGRQWRKRWRPMRMNCHWEHFDRKEVPKPTISMMNPDCCWWMPPLERHYFVEVGADILLFLYLEEPVIVFHI